MFSIKALALLAGSVLSIAMAQMPARADGASPSATITTANLASNHDATTQAQLSSLMAQWSAAVGGFAFQVGSIIPWNQSNGQTPIAYAPMALYAGPGGAVACGFPAASGSALPTVNIGSSVNLALPVDLAGLKVNLSSSGAQQGVAYQQAAGASMQFFPSTTGGPFGGTFCASATYNQPGPQQVQISTWYAADRSAAQSVTVAGGSNTPQMVLFGAGQSLSNAVSSTMPSAQPMFSGAPAGATQAGGSWLGMTPSGAAQFMSGR